jgi:hypothetical protein
MQGVFGIDQLAWQKKCDTPGGASHFDRIRLFGLCN